MIIFFIFICLFCLSITLFLKKRKKKFLTFVLSKEKFSIFSYEKKIKLNNGILKIANYSMYQHRVNFCTKKRVFEIRSGNFKTTSFFVENRTSFPYTKQDFKGKDFYSVEITMNNPLKNLKSHFKDNFPRKLIFLDEDKNSILELIFNKYGFMIKAIDEKENIIYRDEEVDKEEEFLTYLRLYTM